MTLDGLRNLILDDLGRHLARLAQKKRDDVLAEVVRLVIGRGVEVTADAYLAAVKSGLADEVVERRTAEEEFDDLTERLVLVPRRHHVDLLNVLAAGEARGIRSEIFSDFLDHLRRIETSVAAYVDRPLSDWDDACWTGFFLELQSRLGEGKWNYVPNASGGFMGFWWHFHGNKYLQLKQEHICFKIKVEDKAQQSARWEEWHRILAAEAAERSVPILRPRRRNGTWMTVAVLDGDYRQQRNGKLDLSATIQVLRSAEVLLEAAVARFSALV